MSDRKKKAIDELQLKLLPVTEDPTFQGGLRSYPKITLESIVEADMLSRHEPPTPTLH